MFYTRCMSIGAETQIGVFKNLSIPRICASDWSPGTAKMALRELRRLRGELASAEAVLVGVMKTETGRDTKATLARSFGMSSAEAAKAEQVADVVIRIPGADNALAEGHVTGEHLRKLAPITDPTEAAELFELAPSQTPDEFAKTVDRYRIEKDADGWRARQRAARSVRFFKADDGCTGIRAILPTLEGERVKAAINEACDTAWRAAHPERAESIGGHDDEPRERRLADALVSLVLGNRATSASGPVRTALIVTVQAETLEAQILGDGPLPTDDAIDLINDARTDLYAAIQTTDGTILKFGRSRRLASALQKLALSLRENGQCAWQGCTTPWNRCDADHDPPWDHGGLTDIDKMKLMCTNGHHTHRHDTKPAQTSPDNPTAPGPSITNPTNPGHRHRRTTTVTSKSRTLARHASNGFDRSAAVVRLRPLERVDLRPSERVQLRSSLRVHLRPSERVHLRSSVRVRRRHRVNLLPTGRARPWVARLPRRADRDHCSRPRPLLRPLRRSDHDRTNRE